MNALVVNLTRFGDLLQSQPAVTGLAESGARVGVVCLDNFAQAAGLLSDVERVFALPGGGLLAGVDEDWRRSAGALSEWVAAVRREFAPDVVVNLTSTTSARLLSRLLSGNGARLTGFGLDDHGFGLHSTPWAAFLNASSVRRGCSPFNLVDLFAKTAGLPAAAHHGRVRQPSGEARRAAAELLKGAGDAADSVAGFVALQLGASKDIRAWPAERFAAVGDALWSRYRLRPVLLGTKSERELGRRYAAAAKSPFVDLQGATNLETLAAVLTQVRLLATNDTGTMHLAAGLNTPVVAVFLCTAQPWDTGPRAPGAICLEPDMACHPCGFDDHCAHARACREAVPVPAVLEAARLILSGGIAARPAEFAGARAWRTSVRPDGMLGLTRLDLPAGAVDDRWSWIEIQRAALVPFLDEQADEQVGPWPGEAGSEPLSVTCARLSPAAAGRLEALFAESEALLTLLGEQGRALSAAPIERLKAKFLALWQRLAGVWTESGLLDALGRMWAFEAQEAASMEAALQAIARYRRLIAALRAAAASAGAGGKI